MVLDPGPSIRPLRNPGLVDVEPCRILDLDRPAVLGLDLPLGGCLAVLHAQPHAPLGNGRVAGQFQLVLDLARGPFVSLLGLKEVDGMRTAAAASVLCSSDLRKELFSSLCAGSDGILAHRSGTESSHPSPFGEPHKTTVYAELSRDTNDDSQQCCGVRLRL